MAEDKEVIDQLNALAGVASRSEDRALVIPDDRALEMERGLREYHRVRQELEQTRVDRDALKLQVEAQRVHIEEMQREIDYGHDRVAAANRDRDNAVAERAVLESLFAIIRKVLDEARMPDTVLQITRLTPSPKVDAGELATVLSAVRDTMQKRPDKMPIDKAVLSSLDRIIDASIKGETLATPNMGPILPEPEKANG